MTASERTAASAIAGPTRRRTHATAERGARGMSVASDRASRSATGSAAANRIAGTLTYMSTSWWTAKYVSANTAARPERAPLDRLASERSQHQPGDEEQDDRSGSDPEDPELCGRLRVDVVGVRDVVVDLVRLGGRGSMDDPHARAAAVDRIRRELAEARQRERESEIVAATGDRARASLLARSSTAATTRTPMRDDHPGAWDPCRGVSGRGARICGLASATTATVTVATATPSQAPRAPVRTTTTADQRDQRERGDPMGSAAHREPCDRRRGEHRRDRRCSTGVREDQSLERRAERRDREPPDGLPPVHPVPEHLDDVEDGDQDRESAGEPDDPDSQRGLRDDGHEQEVQENEHHGVGEVLDADRACSTTGAC